MSPVGVRSSFLFPLIGTVAVHVGFAYGLTVVQQMIHLRPPPAPMEVSFEVKKEPPPPPPTPPPPPPEAKAPEPPPPPTPQPRPVPRKKVASVTPPPTTPAPPPAPGPPDESPPAPQKVYVMDTGSVIVNPGAADGSASGRPGGTGKGHGGGGEPGSEGTGPKAVPLSSVASMPEALGDYDLSRDYPDEARKQGIEGEAVVRLLVDEEGRVAQTKFVRGPGAGLKEKALELARKLRFKPARDEKGAPVATWITWTFNFTLPR